MKYSYLVRIIRQTENALSAGGEYQICSIRINIFDIEELTRLSDARSSGGSTLVLKMKDGTRYSIVPEEYMGLFHLIGLRNTMLREFDNLVTDCENE